MLILLPPQESDTRLGAEQDIKASPQEWAALRTQAYLLEIYELSGNWGGNYPSELNWTRRRWQETWSLPSLQQAQRLPAETTIRSYLDFNRTYYQQLLSNRACLPWLDWEPLLEETQDLYQWWETALQAKQAGMVMTTKRQALQRLVDRDSRRFYSGQWPAHVPVWRFGDGR